MPAIYIALAALPTSFSSVNDVVVWSPVVDGVTLKKDPVAAAAAGEFVNKANILVGSTINEMYPLLPPAVVPHNLTGLQYFLVLVTLFDNNFAMAINVFLRYLPFLYDTPFDALVEALSDMAFVCPARQTARWASAADMTTFLYSYAHTPSNPLAVHQNCKGACHTAELPAVFYNTDNLDAVEIPFSQKVVGFWASFAARGNPNFGKKRIFPEWPKYKRQTDLNIKLELNTSVQYGHKLGTSPVPAISGTPSHLPS